VLAAFSADRQNHQSQVLVIDSATGKGLRTSGLAKAGDMVGVMERVRASRPRSESPDLKVAGQRTEIEAAEHYFTNTPLIDQSGTSLQFPICRRRRSRVSNATDTTGAAGRKGA
jgi:hypothetical protein